MATRAKTDSVKSIPYLEKRVRFLEKANRYTLDALEMAASLGDFQSSINKLHSAEVILQETRNRIQTLMEFESISFFLVNEQNQEFTAVHTNPESFGPYMAGEVDALVENEIFAWALREKRPVIVSTRNHRKQIILHVMTTSSRTRGMFVGLIGGETPHIPDIFLSLLSIILLSSANALESFELYRMIRDISRNLDKKDNYKLLFEAAPDGVEVLDGRGYLLDCNRTQLTLLGYRREDLIGRHTKETFAEASRSVFERKFNQLKVNGYVEGEVELLCKSGSVLPVWRKEKAMYDGEGSFIGCVVYNRDLSIRKQTEEEKKLLEARLQRSQKMEALGTLAGGVAHDLNNILGGLVSYPELLLMQLPQDSLLRKPILTIQKSGEKAAAIVQDLLTLARRGAIPDEVCNLNTIIAEHLQTPEHEKLKSFHPHVKFEVSLGADLLNVAGSSVHLSKTVMNLLSNAAEAMKQAGTVTVETRNAYIDRPIRGYDEVKEGDYVVLSVSDEGIGISEDDLERIFEPFYTKKVMGRSGTGLGLAVVWGTVKDHKGYIEVAGRAGGGTVFSIYLPATRREVPRHFSTFKIEEYQGAGQSILIVDDVEEQREIASILMRRLGYRVAAATSGEEALEYLKTHRADLLILDMVMDPGIDGLETYRRVLDLHPGQKAIIVSGYSETERVKEAQRLGAGEYVRKPYQIERIGLAVKNAMEMHPLSDAF